MKIILIPDKFKGTLSSKEVCEAMEIGIKGVLPEAEIQQIPMADGGEGSLEVIFENIGGKWIHLEVYNPLFEKTQAKYLVKEEIAFIEMAQASGLQLIPEDQRNPLKSSSYGTGQLIKHALESGLKQVFLLVGGSATNDAGIGMASALGFEFLDSKGRPLEGTGENLASIEEIKFPKIFDLLSLVDFKVLTDVNNHLYGPNGATKTYAAQKGASKNDIEILEKGMIKFADLIKVKFDLDINSISGAGAAGGIAAGASFFLHSKIYPGFDTIFEICNILSKCQNADLIISGEGKIDQQTLQGKLINGIADISKKLKIPLAIICGINEITEKESEDLGISKILPLVNADTTIEESLQNTKNLVSQRCKTLMEAYNK